jgi:hypothetical protein
VGKRRLQTATVEADDDLGTDRDHGNTHLPTSSNHFLGGDAIDRDVVLDEGNTLLAKELLRSVAPGSGWG